MDRDENLIADLPYSPPEPPDSLLPLTLSFPQKQPPLNAGQIYSWKVTALFEGREERSVYVPFRVAEPAQVAVLEEELSRAGDHFYLKAVVFAWHGLYEEALQSLSSAPKDPASQDLARSLAAMILERKGLPPTELRRLFEDAG